MITEYRTVAEGGSDQIVEKKSRFIADVFHVETEEEALAHIERIRKQYWDARHHCYAYILGKDQAALRRFSDDGEPSQTAGKPMMEVIEGRELCDTLVVVTRYFGGTLLGTGGLVRAYTQAAIAGIEASRVVTRQLVDVISVDTDYNGIGRILYLLGQMELSPRDSRYTDKVRIVVAVPVADTGKLMADITEATNGKAVIEKLGQEFQ